MALPPPAGTLGDCRLERVIGLGGMGQVWAATHIPSGAPVAVKVMTQARARDPRFVAAFEREVRAVAALDHPGIVAVIDSGVVGAQAAQGHLVEGSPYLVMERAELGCLDAQVPDWPSLRAILLGLLDALAHAHARGVIHRDLKPANVLLFEHGPRVVPKLADFGIAWIHAFHHDTPTEAAPTRIAGSPPYMAPEQILGHPWRFGPWTDLYALGCLGWRLATGLHLFQGEGLHDQLGAHLSGRRADWAPQLAMPAGLCDWLLGLTARSPRDRFRWAADAAQALCQLGPAGPAIHHPADRSQDAHPSMVTLHLDLFDEDVAPWTPPRPTASPQAPRGQSGVPEDWHAPPALPGPRQGTGLGLVGLRRPRLVGRERARDTLWAQLRQVHTTGQPGMVLIEGAAGTGKSSLARWLCERAHELGAAANLRAVHAQRGGRGDGLGPMVARFFGGSRDPAHTRQGLDDRLGTTGWAHEVQVLSRWTAPDPGHLVADALQRPTSGHAVEHAALARVLTALTTERMVILWLDDLQWAPGAIEFLERLFGPDAAPGPILVVATTRPIHGPGVHPAVPRFLAQTPHEALSIGPLSTAEATRFAGELLALQQPLSRVLAQRTGGLPLYLTQVLADWVDADRLEASPSGYRLRSGTPDIPDTLHRLWARRLGRSLQGRPPDDLPALELAATLGPHVDGREWARCIALAGLAPGADLPAFLARRGMVRLHQSSASDWSFAHGGLAKTLQRGAAEADRAGAHHRVCAAMLAEAADVAATERLAHHLLAAGDQRAALRPLADAAAAQLSNSRFGQARQTMAIWRKLASDLDLPPAEPAWAHAMLADAALHRHIGQPEQALALHAQLMEAAAEHGWTEIEADNCLWWGTVHRMRHEPDQAMARVRQAIALAEQAGRIGLLAQAQVELGLLLERTGQWIEAKAVTEAARAGFAAVGEAPLQAKCAYRLSGIARQQGDWAATEAHLGEALAGFKRAGAPWGMGACHSALGDLARARGDVDEALSRTRGAQDILTRLGHPDRHIASLNLALAALEVGDSGAIWGPLDAAEASWQRRGLHRMLAISRVVRAWGLAAEGRWNELGQALEGLADALQAAKVVEVDVALAAQRVAELAGAEHPGLAAQAQRIAADQAAVLGGGG